MIVVPVVAGIGNALLAEPMVRQLRAGLPDTRIVVLAMIPPMAAVFGGIAGVETLVTGRGLSNLARSVRTTRRLRPNVYLVPFPSNRWQYNALAAASGAKRVVLHGYPVGTLTALNFLHSDRVPAERGLHDVTQNLRLLEPLGIEPDYADVPRFVPTPADRVAAATSLARIGLVDAPSGTNPSGRFDAAPRAAGAASFVVLHAGSAKTILAEAKRWPTEKYAALQRATQARELSLRRSTAL